MSPRSKRVLKWSIFVAVFVLAGLFIWNRSGPEPVAHVVPNPNGYDDLLKARAALQGNLADTRAASDEQLAEYVRANSAAFDHLSVGLARESRAPFLANAAAVADNLEVMGGMKALAVLLAAQGELARRQGDWAQVVRSATNGVLLARRISAGDNLMQDMIAAANEHIALGSLESAVGSLPFEAARDAARALADLDASRVPIAQVFANEEALARRSSSLGGRILWYAILRRRMQPAFQSFAKKRATLELRVRFLSLSLAARAFQLEHGKPPATTADLVPHYLPAVPTDPNSNLALDLPPSSKL